ncbi:restriction endonuclease subunit S [Arthrospiribacter ruber]|uniref:Restriction endonuclease subunit S n=1 Tax=Arthrospiribacter ruber TaxID=2487934 RepID=A0A951IX69_9BACT|nr:restriction endonuclease subunit S [Arthrospiribacter ruber]MBW3467909.1 restriction endonuclease subunit S [Arthrospiribacter ruber]
MIDNVKKYPKLRFLNFEKDWEEGSLGDFTSWKSGGTPSKEVEDYWNGNIPWISASSMIGTKFSDSEKKVTELGSKKGTRIAKKGSILLLVRGSMLFNKIPVGIAAKDVTFNQDVKAIIPNDEIDKEFLLQWFLKSEKSLLGIVAGTGIGAGKLDTKELHSLNFKFPSLPEQQKIASFLSSVDERIELLERKKEKLEAYKKGVMQQIFSQKIHFKHDDGSEFPDWEEKRLGNICDIVKGQQLNKSELEMEGTYPAINGGIEPSGYSGDWNTEANTITISEGGNSCGFVNFIKTKFWSGGHCYTLQKISKIAHVPFLFQLLKFNEKKIMKLRVGSGLPNIQKGDIQKLLLMVPCLPEQKKIAVFLNTIDENLETLDSQIQGFRTWKKGLLQQMFV